MNQDFHKTVVGALISLQRASEHFASVLRRAPILGLVEGIWKVSSGPPVPGYEDLLTTDKMPPEGASIMARFLPFRGQMNAEEDDRIRQIRPILARLAQSQGSLARSRQARGLSELVKDQTARRLAAQALPADLTLAEFEQLVELAIRREGEGDRLRAACVRMLQSLSQGAGQACKPDHRDAHPLVGLPRRR